MSEKIKVSMLAEKWSNQDVVEITKEEFLELDKMDDFDKWFWMTSKFPKLDYFETVNVEIREIEEKTNAM